MSDFPEDPAKFVSSFLAPHVSAGRLVFKQRDIDSDKFLDELNIAAAQAPDGFGAFMLDDEQAIDLFTKSLTNKRVADFGKLVAAHNLETSGPLPTGLRLLASFALTDRLPKGKRGRKRGDNYERDHWIWSTVRLLNEAYGMKIARSEASQDIDHETGEPIVENPSACDYVTAELQKFINIHFDRVVDIYYEMEAFSKSPDKLDPIKEIARKLTKS